VRPEKYGPTSEKYTFVDFGKGSGAGVVVVCNLGNTETVEVRILQKRETILTTQVRFLVRLIN